MEKEFFKIEDDDTVNEYRNYVKVAFFLSVISLSLIVILNFPYIFKSKKISLKFVFLETNYTLVSLCTLYSVNYLLSFCIDYWEPTN